MHSLIIHMARSVEREGLVQNLSQFLPDAQVIDAVDGRKLSDDERRAVYQQRVLKPRPQTVLKDAEIGCFLSHRKAWQALIASDSEMAWIVEDDVAIDPASFEALQTLVAPYQNADCLIRVPLKDRERPGDILAQNATMQLIRPKVIGLSAAMYLLGRNAAERILTGSQPFDRPVDTYLQMRWHTKVDSLSVRNSGARSAAFDVGTSTIQSKKSLTQELKRIIPRAMYRAQTRYLSGKGIE